MPGSRETFWAGVRAELPILLGVIPFGMIYGVAAAGAGLSDGQAQGMSAIVFAGSAQFIMAQLFGQQTPAAIIVATAVLVNLRHALYSASVAPYLQHLPTRWKLALAYLLTDEAYAVAIVHFEYARPHPARHWYLLGAGLALWSTWQLSTAGGILLGAAIPAAWGLDFTLALTFIALVVPALRDRPSVAAALVAGVTAAVGHAWPLQLGLLTAAVLGIGAGVGIDAWRARPVAAAAEKEAP